MSGCGRVLLLVDRAQDDADARERAAHDSD
jgi:hypothetical protein